VDEYHQMIQAGILGEDDNVELLEGWIVPEMPRNPAHDALIAWVHNRVLAPRLREGWYINLVDHQIEVYTQPTGPVPVPDYRMRQDYKRSDLVPLVIDGIALGPIPGSDILP
jgi:hypothetical protein